MKAINDQDIIGRLIPSISAVWENVISVHEMADKFNQLIYTFETFTKGLAAIAYGRLRNYNADISEVDQLLASAFCQPSLGDWSNLARLCRKLLSAENDKWALILNKKIMKKTNQESILKLIGATKQLQGLKWNKGSVKYGELFSIIIELRNRTKGHGAVSGGFYNEINDDFMHTLREILTEFDDLIGEKYYTPLDIKCDINGKKECRYTILEGNIRYIDKQNLEEDELLASGKIYCYYDNLPNSWCLLWPLMHIDINNNNIYYYNQFPREGRAEYICYANGNSIFLDYKSCEELLGISQSARAPRKILLPVKTSDGGVTHNLPSPDWYRFVQRQELEAEVKKQIEHPRLYITTLDGIGGCGKTALALRTAFEYAEQPNEDLVQFDYIVWATAKATKLIENGIVQIDQQLESLVDLLKEILRVSGFSHYIRGSKEDELKNVVFEILELARFLIIIDNLETIKDSSKIWDFLIDPKFVSPTKVLVTSRHRQDRAELVVNVRGMTEDQVKEMIDGEYERLHIQNYPKPDKSLISKLTRKTGGIPIAIKQVIGHVAKGIPLDDSIDRLPQRPNDVLDFCFPESFKMVEDNARLIFFCLSKVGDATGVNELIFLSSLDESALDKAIIDLTRLSLIERTLAGEQGDLYSLLPLTQKFAEREIENFPEWEVEIQAKLEDLYQLREMVPFDTKALPMYGIVTVERMMQLALSCAARSDYDKADFWFHKAVEADKSNYQTWLSRAKYQYKELRDIQSARHGFSKAAELSNNEANVLISWAHMERSENNYKKSIELFTRVLKTDPKNKPANHGYGVTLYERGVSEKSYGKNQYDEGRIKRGQSLIRDSIAKLKLALHQNPDTYLEKHHNVVTYAVLSKAYNRLNMNDEAISVCHEALSLEPNNGRIKDWLQQVRHWQEIDTR